MEKLRRPHLRRPPLWGLAGCVLALLAAALAAVWQLGVDEAFIPSAGAPCRFIRIERSAEKEESP